MEKQMALNMWNRSEEKNTMRYSAMISDGDVFPYSAICDNVDYLVEKEECVNHFSKRLGTRLRNLKKEYVIETMTKTGRTMKKSVLGGRGKLTDTTIHNLGRYFNKAIRDNKSGTVEEMRRACMSGFMHVSSSNENPKHEYCPSGEDSWCFYKKAESLDQQPPNHETMNVKMLLNDDESNGVQEV